MADVLISYAQADKQIAEQIAKGLTEQGISVWNNNVLLGENWSNFLVDAIKSTPVFIPIVSRNSEHSPLFNIELSLALAEEEEEKNKRIIPVFLDQTAINTPIIGKFKGIFLKEGSEKELQIKYLAKEILDEFRNHYEDGEHTDNSGAEIIDAIERQIERIKSENQKLSHINRLKRSYLIWLLFATYAISGILAAIGVAITSRPDLFAKSALAPYENYEHAEGLSLFILGVLFGATFAWLAQYVKRSSGKYRQGGINE